MAEGLVYCEPPIPVGWIRSLPHVYPHHTLGLSKGEQGCVWCYTVLSRSVTSDSLKPHGQ